MHVRILSSQRRGRWCSRTAAAARSRRRTRSRRSTTGWRSAPTASSSTSTSRATASSSSTTTATLDRTTTVRAGRAPDARELARSTPAIVSRADAHPFRGQGSAFRRWPTCSRAIATCRIIIELKVNRAELAAAVVEVVRRADAVDRVCLGSFGRRVAARGARLEPALATSAAREEVRWALYRVVVPLAGDARRRTRLSGPERAGRRASSRRVRRRRARAGLGVQVWTVDTEADARRLLELGRRRADHRSPRPHRPARALALINFFHSRRGPTPGAF